MAPRRRGHRVADFNTIEDLVQHAADQLGATHAVIAGPETRIYFPRGGQWPYEEARVWRKGGYWHAEGPHARRGVTHLPRDTQPLGRPQRRRAAAEGPRRRSPRARARGIYYDMPYINPRDYVLHYREGRIPRWDIDRVGAGGTHTTIGPTRGYSRIEDVRRVIEEDAHIHAVNNATIHDASGEELGRLVYGRLHWFPGALTIYPPLR